MSLEVIVPIIALIGVLILVLPGFIQTNYNLKIFIKNFNMDYCNNYNINIYIFYTININ